MEEKCQGCARPHREWFETSACLAIKVARHWVEWMRTAEPYDGDGLLKTEWRNRLRRFEIAGEPVKAESLLRFL